MAAKRYNYSSTDLVTLTRGGPKNGVRSVYPRYEREVAGVLIHIDAKRPLRFFTPG